MIVSHSLSLSLVPLLSLLAKLLYILRNFAIALLCFSRMAVYSGHVCVCAKGGIVHYFALLMDGIDPLSIAFFYFHDWAHIHDL